MRKVNCNNYFDVNGIMYQLEDSCLVKYHFIECCLSVGNAMCILGFPNVLDIYTLHSVSYFQFVIYNKVTS